MTSKPKTLVTLTVLRMVEGVGIRYALTDGHGNTIQASSSNFERLEKDFLVVVKELIQGNPTYKEGDINFGMGNWLERFVRFAIDPELVSYMINEYQENAEGAEIIKLSEYFINLFDKVNGNNAISQAMRDRSLLKDILSGEINLDQTDASAEQTWLDKLTAAVFEIDALDPHQQGLTFIQATLKDNVKIDLNVVRAVGNVFVAGSIGGINIRIYRSNVVQLFITMDEKFKKYPTKLFSTMDKQSFITSLRRLISTQLS